MCVFRDPKHFDVSKKVREWVLKRCNNNLDPAISMLEKMPSLQVRIEYVLLLVVECVPLLFIECVFLLLY